MEHDKYKEMLVLYSYNELNKEERNELDRHMLGCNSCKDELEELKKLHELVTANISDELDENALFESRQELLAEIRNLNRKKFHLSGLWDFLTTPTSGSLKLAYSLASVTILFTVGYFAFFNKSDYQIPIDKDLAKSESSVTNLQFINSDFDKGEVEITYDQITPVKLKGKVNDAEIQKVLARSLIDNKNPGIRLKTVNAILSENKAGTSEVLKDALLNAMMYDNNPGVRKEAMNALCNLQFNDSDFDKGEVEITYDQITPVKLKGKVNDAEIQKVLARSLVDNENPGIRLKTVNAILSENKAGTSDVLKDALLNAMMYDNNPGVRKEAMNALCNLQFDDKIQDAMIHVLQNDKNSGLRIQAINCLGVKNDLQKITDPNTINVLRKKMQEDENSYIKLRAKTILTKLES